MTDFVDHRSIVRAIWGDSDLILLIFAGSAAEFALNRAVDWLFFTNRLPDDPIGRLFSTARYAQEIVFVDETRARQTLDRISAIHRAVERLRGERIPDWAYRDVLYMLIDYSERAHRLLHRPLTAAERQDLYAVFRRVGVGLDVPELPPDYTAWRADRERHLARDLAYSDCTARLYARYRRRLGAWRYALLLQVQALLAPRQVRRLLRLEPCPMLACALRTFGPCDLPGLRGLAHRFLLPARYLDEVRRFRRAGVD
jgi:hypothetical protein